jgi:hypothetical protein
MATTSTCPECITELREAYPGQTAFSRAFIEVEIHPRHQPLHPNQVGSAHRRRAKREWDRWESLSPYAQAVEDGGTEPGGNGRAVEGPCSRPERQGGQS